MNISELTIKLLLLKIHSYSCLLTAYIFISGCWLSVPREWYWHSWIYGHSDNTFIRYFYDQITEGKWKHYFVIYETVINLKVKHKFSVICGIVVNMHSCESLAQGSNLIIDGSWPAYPTILPSHLGWLINSYLGKVNYGNMDVTLALCPKVVGICSPEAHGSEWER